MVINNRPRISIVTPSYNQSQFLEQTIRSVVRQGYSNLEYVIIDGGSDDGSVEIIEKYDEKLKYWVSEPDAGHGNALNKGFSRTTGEIMAWINSDDMYTPWCFETVAEIFTAFPHVMWISGLNSNWNIYGAIYRSVKNPKNIYDFLLGRYAWIQQESVFWRRELWEMAGGKINENYQFMVDGELWTRFFLKAPLYYVDCILGGYRVHDQNRGLLYRKQCRNEIEMAIEDMKVKCPGDVLAHSRKLEFFMKYHDMRYLRPFVRRIMERTITSTLDEASYKNIAWHSNRWVETRIPFSL